ncbi:hypothetical protein C3489_01415 [Streptomyces sp. Ru71]|uniref:hypothetical protein n=1 Tax=Streptomyces sp. Ru71 TaxID=2080746 RepID=UPI000CDD2AE9|nr:hypothetical protein [Streptomyces sp. Ru71]POX56943.1 hypothetical protein C3489_01415 [Streptomyces sp. Ru71]
MRKHEEPATRRRGAEDPQVEAFGRRFSRRQLTVAGAVVLVAVVAVLVALLVPRSEHRGTAAGAPSWSGAGVACRSDPLTHVHNPKRLRVVADCATVSGVVRKVQYRPNDGNTHLTVAVDEKYQPYLRSANKGLLNVEVVPPDEPHVIIPPPGKHATFYGAWVLDRNQRHAAELHPAWRIVPDGVPAARATPKPVSSPGKLSVTVDLPAAVAVGEPFRAVVNTRTTTGTRTVPASQVHVFAEITNASGKGVGWKAASTNTLGSTSMNFVALHAPGAFVVHFYATKDGQSAVVAKSLIIKRR